MRTRPRAAESNTYKRALLACLPASIILAAATLAAGVDTKVDGRDLGYAAGMAVFPALIAALVLWLIVRRKRRPWPYWRLLALGSVFVLAVQLIATAGQLSN
ncbi:MAG TPA: hypothetical protein VGX25_01490 [Actinophytocola sp.]|uniref:hypothetical protein n=1 Tax=Actinophytocola sp. TaxID=1872138 RepID=UPI002DDCFDF4|nr:hypothetical protein [Actinophytocola sp.]HEV2778050.1 hypothetical protein [Actinophytocola sp.]